MAILFDAPVTPDALTTYVRQIPVPRELSLLNLFPTRYFDDNSIDFAEIVQTNRMARYRSFDGRIHVSERDSGSESRVRLAPLSSSLGIGEYERLQLQFARTGGTNQAALVRAVYNDGTNLTREVQNRLNFAWGGTLVGGKLTINEEGLQSEADYGVPTNQIVNASTLWTTFSAAALDHITAWSDTYEDNNGTTPEQMRTSRRVMRLLEQNQQFVGAIAGTTSGRTRVSIGEINAYLAGEDLPTFGPPIQDRVYQDKANPNVRVVPDDRVFLMPSDENMGSLGYTAMGISATALELVESNVADLSFEEAPGIVGVVEKIGPPYRQTTFVDAVGQPVLSNAKLLMIADVA